jgi:predicted negative regulator of RcsB-dependent stress response
VDEYLSDKEQVERLRQWWRENGWFLIGGVALGLLGLYGYNQYFTYRDGRSEAAAAMYAAVQAATDDSNTAAAETVLGEMRAEYPDHAYTFQAAMLVASAEIVTAPDSATEKLRFAMEQSDDPDLALIARLRLARVLAYREQYTEALALLNVPEPGQFAGRIAEIRGDIHVARGETVAARSAYLEAMVTPGAELLDRSFLQMKLADLSGSSSVPEPAPGGSSNASDPAAEPAPANASPADSAPGGGAADETGEGA